MGEDSDTELICMADRDLSRGTRWGLALTNMRSTDFGADRPIRSRAGWVRGREVRIQAEFIHLAAPKFKALVRAVAAKAARSEGVECRILRRLARNPRRMARHLLVGRRSTRRTKGQCLTSPEEVSDAVAGRIHRAYGSLAPVARVTQARAYSVARMARMDGRHGGGRG